MTKEKLNLSIDSKLKKDFKHFAISNDIDCSSLTEIYIQALKCNPRILDVLKETIITSGNKKNKKKK